MNTYWVASSVCIRRHIFFFFANTLLGWGVKYFLREDKHRYSISSWGQSMEVLGAVGARRGTLFRPEISCERCQRQGVPPEEPSRLLLVVPLSLMAHS